MNERVEKLNAELYGTEGSDILRTDMIEKAFKDVRREALKEAARLAKGMAHVCTAGDIVEALERLAGEETK